MFWFFKLISINYLYLRYYNDLMCEHCQSCIFVQIQAVTRLIHFQDFFIPIFVSFRTFYFLSSLCENCV